MQTKAKTSKKIESPEGGIVRGGSNPAGVIYVDQDSDITSIVSKLRVEEAKDVKIVVPKNSAALKSGVNLKLLARTAHTRSKNLSLITSDPKLVSMSAAAKISTAPNLNAPSTLIAAAAAGGIKVNNPDEDFVDSAETISEAQAAKDLDEDLTIDGAELDDATSANSNSDLEPDPKSKKSKSQKGTGSKKVPNFYDFRKKALIGIGAFLGLVVIILLLMTTRKSAVINIKANAQRVDINFSAKLNESATETTKEELKVVKKSGSKSTTDTTPATGEQDIGAKASGKVTLTNCAKVDGAITISSGTGVSAGGLTYITTSAATIPKSRFSGSGRCEADTGRATVDVIAQNPGANYNSGSRSYSVSGAPSGVTGQGGEMSGGTTQVVKVVSQADVNTLKEKLATNNQEAYKDELIAQFNSSQDPLEETFSVQLGDVQITPAVGQQAETVTGSVVANYSMYGAEKEELEKILELNINEAKTDPSQSIVKNGTDELKVASAENGEFTFTTVAYVGPNIDQEKIKNEVAGKKKGEAIQIIESGEGIDDASVKMSPFWASSLPKAEKIEIKIEIAGQ